METEAMDFDPGSGPPVQDGGSGLEETSLLQATRKYMIDLYLADKRPWVVAFSGGKDSTVLLQLVYEMLIEHKHSATKPVYVVSSDTRVEPPNIADYIERTTSCIEAHARSHHFPVHVRLVSPRPDESFWGKLIGKGYPSPTRWFRWCTSSMKIRPARRIIDEIISEHGSVVLLLGTRRTESSDRGKRMDARQCSARKLNPHNEIPDALVATPIAEWENEEVWEYLARYNPPPWGGDHGIMRDLYRQASGGECPFILDLIAPSCGGTRFGCWTCTVVKVDRSMKGFITSGETWMAPLHEFRDWLKVIREDPDMRSNKRRDGTVKPGQLGPFTPQARKQILERLLQTEQDVGRQLITDQEIDYIQRVWTKDYDLAETAIRLAERFGRKVEAVEQVALPLREQEILEELLAEYEISPELVKHLLYLVHDKYPSLEIWGAKAGLERDVAEAIAKVVELDEQADLSDAI